VARRPGRPAPAQAAVAGQARVTALLGGLPQVPDPFGGDRLGNKRVHDSSPSFRVSLSPGKTRGGQRN
jgi:hypothetical protein